MGEAIVAEDGAGGGIVFEDVGVYLVQTKYMLGILAQEGQHGTGIATATGGMVDDETNLGTAVGRTEVEEVDGAYEGAEGAVFDHEAHLLVGIDIVGVGLDVLLQEVARIGGLAGRHAPLAGVVLDVEEEVEIGGLGSTELEAVGLQVGIHRRWRVSEGVDGRLGDEGVTLERVGGDTQGIAGGLLEQGEQRGVGIALGVVHDGIVGGEVDIGGEMSVGAHALGGFNEAVFAFGLMALEQGAHLAEHGGAAHDKHIRGGGIDGGLGAVAQLVADVGKERAAPDGHGDGDAHHEGVVRVVLAEEETHGLVEGIYVAVGALNGALALVMEHAGGNEVVLVPALEDAVGEVDIFAVHEEVFVEQAHAVEGGTAKQHAGTGDDLYLAGLLLVEVAHVVAAEDARAGEEGGETGHLAEGDEGCGEAAAALEGEGAVGAQHIGPCPTRLGMEVHEADHIGKGMLSDDGVGVEQQHILAGREAYGLVVGTGESYILGILDEGDLGETLAQIGYGAIGGEVVDHEDFDLQSFRGAAHGVEALREVVLDVVVDDDD